MRNILIILTLLILNSCNMNNSKIYEFEVENAKHEKVSLSAYKGKVMLIVNTASRCGFTPQYTELETMYKELKDKGFEILDFPCNQFGQQAPESDEEYVSFCQLNYQTEFPQFHKIDVNGENEIPLYTYLKSQKKFVDFDPKHNLTPILVDIFDKNMPGWRETSDIKWNFTKFLIDREGNVVERFEPTATIETMLPKIKELL